MSQPQADPPLAEREGLGMSFCVIISLINLLLVNKYFHYAS